MSAAEWWLRHHITCRSNYVSMDILKRKWFDILEWVCSETTLTGESRFHISPPRGFKPVTLVAGSKQVSSLDQWDMVRIIRDCRLSTGLPPSSRLFWLWSQKGDLQRAWNRDRKAVWDQVRLSHCRYEGLVAVGDEALLMINHVGVTNVARQR